VGRIIECSILDYDLSRGEEAVAPKF